MKSIKKFKRRRKKSIKGNQVIKGEDMVITDALMGEV
jgi:hypothetical protein